MVVWNQSSIGSVVTPASARMRRRPEPPSVKAVSTFPFQINLVDPNQRGPSWVLVHSKDRFTLSPDTNYGARRSGNPNKSEPAAVGTTAA